ncbi:MAG TPA: hypothetical protein VFH31_11955, partial [Pyrinomonadaceae bacterium]|nr:hypothetical protein [Pyrinomonadaceae bacterium]
STRRTSSGSHGSVCFQGITDQGSVACIDGSVFYDCLSTSFEGSANRVFRCAVKVTCLLYNALNPN